MKELGRIIELPKITDPRGNLTVAEAFKDVPFDIHRAYWVYDVPGGESRGGHAHKRLLQLVVAMSGSFTVLKPRPGARSTISHRVPFVWYWHQSLLMKMTTSMTTTNS